ncbi:uncharacterized protein M421DRAFT_415935 [Didymella exigua CBS 183.55]|uniref:Uncharacterized protein n=1 Tax=Didymella exigua CBS 183.55 TaxID=1150837 RepID=A0A6A5RYR1_9PLEO|nr:uncharacterized protein M421DRAFT_415935 [Didymella exigua CBS 183.55]KAF1933595.1 hypothetical protein M421DRAFT_415935 [Didymella exigua CBS 183.55]
MDGELSFPLLKTTRRTLREQVEEMKEVAGRLLDLLFFPAGPNFIKLRFWHYDRRYLLAAQTVLILSIPASVLDPQRCKITKHSPHVDKSRLRC